MGIPLVTQDAAHKGFAGHSRCTDFHALLNNLEHRVFCSKSLLQYKGVLVRVLKYLHQDQKLLVRIEERWKKNLSHRILHIEGSAEHSRCTCVDKPSRSH